MTPLRDVAGLADNLPLLIVAAIVVFRASIEPQRSGEPGASAAGSGRGRAQPGWTTIVWGISALYILYRIVARAAGSPELPFGNCLVVETILIPIAMAVVDGFLLAWLLAELRNAGLDVAGEGRLDPLQAVALMPAAALACVAALPARYVAAFVVLANDHLPTSIQNTPVGGYIRWQLGDWGLTDLQAVALVVVGLAGAVAWTRGRIGEAIVGYARLLATEGGHLVAALAMAAVAAGRAIGGRVRRRAAPARAVLGPERGRQLRPLRHAAGRALDARGPHRAGPALAPDRHAGPPGRRPDRRDQRRVGTPASLPSRRPPAGRRPPAS